MKKLLALLLSATLLLSTLTACRAPIQENTSLTLWFYENGVNNESQEVYDTAVREFQAHNSKITYFPIDMSQYTIAEYKSKLTADLMAGKGPDVIFFNSRTFPDIYKTMATGVFADLTDYLKADETYQESHYFQDVIKEGQYQGKQFFIPFFFEPDYMLTSNSSLALSGVNLANCKTFTGYVNELALSSLIP